VIGDIRINAAYLLTLYDPEIGFPLFIDILGDQHSARMSKHYLDMIKAVMQYNPEEISQIFLNSLDNLSLFNQWQIMGLFLELNQTSHILNLIDRVLNWEDRRYTDIKLYLRQSSTWRGFIQSMDKWKNKIEKKIPAELARYISHFVIMLGPSATFQQQQMLVDDLTSLVLSRKDQGKEFIKGLRILLKDSVSPKLYSPYIPLVDSIISDGERSGSLNRSRFYSFISKLISMNVSFDTLADFTAAYTTNKTARFIKIGYENYLNAPYLLPYETTQKCVVDMSREQGERYLQKIASIAKKELSYTYVDYIKDGQRHQRFFSELAYNDTDKFYKPASIASHLLNDKDIRILDMGYYHVHPISLSEKENGETLLSAWDINALIRLQQMRLSGISKSLDFHVITGYGQYTLHTKKDVFSNHGGRYKTKQYASDYAMALSQLKDDGAELDAISLINSLPGVSAKYQYHDSELPKIITAYRALEQVRHDFNADKKWTKSRIDVYVKIMTEQLNKLEQSLAKLDNTDLKNALIETYAHYIHEHRLQLSRMQRL